jgi:uncharacterized protein (TIGR02996 family)
MNDRDALQRAILAFPDEDTPRLAFADWLQENGDSERAEFIRAQIEFAQAELFSPPARAAAERAESLLRTHGRAWGEHLQGDAEAFAFARGFIGHVTIEAARAQRVLPGIFQTDPVQALRALRHPVEHELWVSLEPLFEAPELQYLRALDLPTTDLGATFELDALAGSPHLTGLTRLNLSGNPIPPHWLIEFLAGPNLTAVAELDLSEIPNLGPAVTQGLLRASHRRFRRLDLSGVIIRSNELNVAMAADCLSSVADIRLRWGAYPTPGPLTHLDLGWVIPSERLQVLDLDGQGLGADGVKELIRKPEAAHLRWLGLARNVLGPGGAQLLVAAKHLDLYYLNVEHNNLRPRDVASLRKRFPNAVIQVEAQLAGA